MLQVWRDAPDAMQRGATCTGRNRLGVGGVRVGQILLLAVIHVDGRKKGSPQHYSTAHAAGGQDASKSNRVHVKFIPL